MATDFSSLDKLIEFGLGIGIATQMMNTMNSVIARTAYPGVGINPGLSQPAEGRGCQGVATLKKYYIANDEKVAGPFDEKEMERLVSERKIDSKTFCWIPGMPAWKFAEDIPEINKLFLLNS